MTIGNGIKLSTGFDLNSKSPLDNRTLFKTIEERDLLPDINLYEGLVCYVVSTQQNYQYINGQWKTQTGGTEIVDIYHVGNEPPTNKDIFWIDKQDDISNSVKYFNSDTHEWEEITSNVATSIHVIDVEDNFESSNVEDCLKELSNTLSLKIDDVLLDENNILTFYSSGNIIKQIELPASKAKAICGTFLAGELNVGEGLETQTNELDEPTQWIDNVTPVNAFNLNKIENKILTLTRLVKNSSNNIYVGSDPPTDVYDVWIDTSDDNEEVTENVTNAIIEEFKSMFQFMKNKIEQLEKTVKQHEARILYLEEFGGSNGGGSNGGGGSDNDTNVTGTILTFEDGTILTFEDGSILTFEDVQTSTSSSIVLTFENNEVMTFEDGTIMTFEESKINIQNTVLTFENNEVMTFEDNAFMTIE